MHWTGKIVGDAPKPTACKEGLWRINAIVMLPMRLKKNAALPKYKISGTAKSSRQPE
jgi:hypothetical protein